MALDVVMAGVRPSRLAEAEEDSTAMRSPKVTWDAPLQDALTMFITSVTGILTIVVADRNGLPVAHASRDKPRTEVVAVSAMAVLAMEAGRSVARNLHTTEAQTVTVEGGTWKVVVSPTPTGIANILVMMEGSTNLGLLKLTLPRLAEAVERHLETL
ncbi:MAG TPA: roadblock/LC7 domain-containing protein [Thermoplasmata archaeon]|nr:roadblock/LC7 domain-containing protein [Thermoplasmata archaeon]